MCKVKTAGRCWGLGLQPLNRSMPIDRLAEDVVEQATPFLNVDEGIFAETYILRDQFLHRCNLFCVSFHARLVRKGTDFLRY